MVAEAVIQALREVAGEASLACRHGVATTAAFVVFGSPGLAPIDRGDVFL
jgi:hypothetical protein